MTQGFTLLLTTQDVSLASRALAVLMWAGLIGLTVALVALMRTRWGQARPLSKCVALSIYAHVLLMTYAYGTKLVIPGPHGDDEGEVVRLNLIGGEDEFSAVPEQSQPQQADNPAPWDQLPMNTPPDFSLEAPPRLATTVDTPAPAPLESASQPQVESVPLPDELPGAAALLTPSPSPVAGPMGPERLNTQTVGFNNDPSVAQSAELPKLAEPSVATDAAEAILAGVDALRAAHLSGSDLKHAAPGAAGTAVTLAWIRAQLNDRPPRRLADGEPVPELYRLRLAADRQRIARQVGATQESDAVVEAALAWLAASQSEDGRWDAKRFGAGVERKILGQDRQGAGADADTGVTGLALLALLGGGHTHLEGPHRACIQKGLEYLVREQKDDGSLAGPAKLYAMMYCHGMAGLALSEAYAMTGDHRLAPYVQNAANYSLRAQHGSSGGWRYLPQDQGDMSQFGWQVMLLKSSELGGLTIPEKNRAGMFRFLQANTSGRYRGLASYRHGEKPSRTMTAEAFACRVFLGQKCGTEMTDEMVEFVLAEPPGSERVDFYYWYYGSLALFQLQDERWVKWNAALQKELIARQKGTGEDKGSFDTDELWSGYGGRVYTTAMAALCLEVYYRYLPVYGGEGDTANSNLTTPNSKAVPSTNVK